MARVQRVSHLIRQALAKILQSEIQSDKIRLLSILSVDISPDLTNARIYYSIYGDDKAQQKAHKFLVKMAPFIKGKLGRVLRIRTIPNLVFVYASPAIINDKPD